MNFRDAVDRYLNILKTKNRKEIEKEKYKLLWEASNFLELIVNYIALNNYGIDFYFGNEVMKKGKKLYRIRAYDTKTDFAKLNEWTAPPNRPQNRANMKGQEALYLGSTETVCLLETHMEKGKEYVLGTYEIMEDIKVGGYLSYNPENILYNYAGMILNAFLIAPARCEKNNELFSFLDAYYGTLTLDDFSNINEVREDGAFELPMKFGVLNQREQYYALTNKLCNIMMKSTPEGIKYSSCYIPFETIGIGCSDFNIVLYDEGISKVKFTNYEIKENKLECTCTDIMKTCLKSKQ